MTLHQLRIFMSVARLKSFSRAAEQLYLTQPAVSAQVRELEKSFGVVFFDRLGRTIQLTAAGTELLGYAERICALADEAKLAMDELVGLKRGRVLIAAVGTAGAYVLPPLVGAFRERHPEISLGLEVANRAICQERLLKNEVDLVIMGRPPENTPHERAPFLSDALVLIAACHHPLRRKKKLTKKELEGETFVFREVGSGTRINADELLRKLGIKTPAMLELSDNSAVKEAVAAGLGIALISRHAITMELALKRLVVLDVVGLPLLRQWYVVHREHSRLSQAAAAFKVFLLDSGTAVHQHATANMSTR